MRKLNKLEYFLVYYSWHYGDYIPFHSYGHKKLDEELLECLSEELKNKAIELHQTNQLEYSIKENEDFYARLDEYLDYMQFEKEEQHYFDMDKSYIQYYLYFFDKKDNKYYRVEIIYYRSLDGFDIWNQNDFNCLEVKKKTETKLITSYELV